MNASTVQSREGDPLSSENTPLRAKSAFEGLEKEIKDPILRLDFQCAVKALEEKISTQINQK